MAARLDRITRRAHTLSQLLEDGVSIRAADMPGADDLMMRIYAAMAQKKRELISECTKGALAAAKARGWCWVGIGVIGRAGPCSAAAARVGRVGAERAAHRLALEIAALQTAGPCRAVQWRQSQHSDFKGVRLTSLAALRSAMAQRRRASGWP